MLNAQGRIQGDLLAFQRGEFYVLESEAGQIPAIREFFERFIIMDDVEIGDISARLTSIGVAGPRAAGGAERAGLLPAAEPSRGRLLDGSWKGIGFSLVRDPIEVRNWYELWLAPENVEAFWNALVPPVRLRWAPRPWSGSGFCSGCREWAWTPACASCRRRQDRIMRCITTKGCYIGQEIVERIRARGQVHRRFTGLIVEGKAPARGSKVMAGEKEIGESQAARRWWWME